MVLQVNSEGSVVDDDRFVALARRLGASPVPVDVWVGPSGAQALGGAAELVGLARTTGMAPGTRLGHLGPQVLPEGDVQNWLPAHGRVKADLDEERRLADTSAGHDHAQLARSQAAAAAALQNADRAVRANLICVHRLCPPRCR